MRKNIFGIVFQLLEIVSVPRPVILSRQQQGVIMQVFNTGSSDPGPRSCEKPRIRQTAQWAATVYLYECDSAGKLCPQMNIISPQLGGRELIHVQVSPFSRHIHILRRGHNNYQDIAGGQTLITLKCKFSITPNNLSLPSLPPPLHTCCHSD